MSGPRANNYYDILEVPQEAPQHEIQRAYQRARATYAPDSPALYTMFTPEEAKQLMILVDEAFAVLGNHNRRVEYDRQLKTGLSKSPEEKSAELPDFDVPEVNAPMPEPIGQTSKLRSSSQVPEGFKRTKFGVYEIDSEFEEEMSQQTELEGEFLRKVRQYKQINLEQVSSETRISRSYIAAIEANDFEALPAPVFVRGFVVQLARLLGLDAEAVATHYVNKYKASKNT